MNLIKYRKYKQAYYIEKEKHLYPFYCYKCLSFHSYSLKYNNNYKGELYVDCPFVKNPLSLEKFLDFGLSLFANEIQCKECNSKFLSNPKINFYYCKENKFYICSYCLNNDSNNNKNNLIFSLNDLCLYCLEHNKKYKYCCSFCSKNLCEDCYINHKKHKYIFLLNHSSDEKNKSKKKNENIYIKKPKNLSKYSIIHYLKIIKNYIKELIDENKDKNEIDFFKTKLYEIQRDLNIFEETNYLLYLIVLKLCIKYVKHNKNEIIPFEVENNLNYFFKYKCNNVLEFKYRFDISQKIKSKRKLTEEEEIFFGLSDLNLNYSIPCFNAIKNINIGNYFKSVKEIEFKYNIGKFDDYNVKFLPKNNLLFIYIHGEGWDDEDDDYEAERELNYLIKMNNYEDIMDYKFKNIIDICEYKINTFIAIDKKNIKFLNLKKNTIYISKEIQYFKDDYNFYDKLTKINILPNNKIIVLTNHEIILILSVDNNNNELIIEKELVFEDYDKIEKIIIFPNINEFILLETNICYIEEIFVDPKETYSKYSIAFKNCDTFQDISKLTLILKSQIRALIELNNKIICAINDNELFIINSKTKKILNKECYKFNFNEIFKLCDTKFLCTLKSKNNLYKESPQFIIFDYNINNNKIQFNSMIVFIESYFPSYIFLISILVKEAIFIYLEDKIYFKKLLMLNDK